MPSGAKKRKAAKKKLKKEAHKNGAHPQGNDDPKSHDERESDSGEVDRDSCDEGTVDNHEVGTKEIDLGDRNVGREVRAEEVTVAGESHNGCAKKVPKSSSSSSSEDDEIVVKLADCSPEVASSENIVISEVYSIEESIIPFRESVKQVVSLPEELNVMSETVLVENSVTEFDFKQNVAENLQLLDEKFRDLPHEKIEEKSLAVGSSVNSSKLTDITSKGDEGLLPMSSGGRWRDDHVKDSEKHKILEEQHLMSSAPSPVRRTSWTNCCGLFEVLRNDSST